MDKAIVITGFVIFFFSMHVDAGTIYKWQDKDGNLHFTDSPGPQQTSADTKQNNYREKITFERLKGDWFGKDRHRKLHLRLDRGYLSMGISPAYGARLPNFSAKWRLGSGAIKFTYTDYDKDPGKIGQSDIIYITHFDGNTMSLLFPGGGRYDFSRVLHRQKSKGNPDVKRKLYGKWNIKGSPLFLDFSEGQFKITTEDKYNIVKRGHWDLAENSLNMTYYTKKYFSQYESIGEQVKYLILQLDSHKLVLERSSDKRREHYFRSILE